jgi:hypothetical protein
MRYFPFVYLIFSLIFSFGRKIDSLLSSMVEFGVSFVYFRWLKKNGEQRGNPTFSVYLLFPNCFKSNHSQNDDIEALHPDEEPPRNGHRPGNDNTETNRSLFVGTPRTIE